MVQYIAVQVWTEGRYKSAGAWLDSFLQQTHTPHLLEETPLPTTRPLYHLHNYSRRILSDTMDTFVTLLTSFFESAPRDGPAAPVPTTNSTHNNPLETLQAGCVVA